MKPTPSSYWIGHYGFTETIYVNFRTSQDRPTDAGGWCIEKSGQVWNGSSGKFEDEPDPSNKGENYPEAQRFPLDVAIQKAQEILRGPR